MPCSPAQLEANRKNSLLSTGPRTPSGKCRSRANGLKHGLTGQGIVLPHEDAEELDRRLATLQAEMRPKNEMARRLVSRVALLTVRLDRSAEHEARATSHRMRKATAEYDDARLAEAERYYSWIASEPATNARRLRGSPEGIDLLLAAMGRLRSDLDRSGVRWGFQHCDQLHHLMGLRRSDVPVSRARALTEAVEGHFQHLDQADRPDLEKLDRQCWAAAALLALIDAEIAALHALREGLDHEGLELDRAEAAARAMFDASPAATLARKYEANTERGLYRALREFRQVQDESSEVVFGKELAAESGDESGSSFHLPPGEEIEEADVDATPPEVDVPAVEAPGGGKMARPRRVSHRVRRDFDPSPRE